MPTLEERVTTLEREVSELRGQFGYLLPLTQQLHREIIALREDHEERFDRLETKVDRLETKVDRLETKVDGLETKFDGLVTDVSELKANVNALPRAIAEVIAKSGKKSR